MVRLDAPAKLTLSLRITGVRTDGFHSIDAEMVSLSLHDIITIDTERTGIAATGRHAAGVPTDGSNLVARALDLAGRTAHVTIDKRVPHGGGLGGGSSVLEHSTDAAGQAAVSIGQYNGDFGTVPEGRIVPFFDGQVRCGDLSIGTWFTIFDSAEFRSDFKLLTFDMFLNGEQLDVDSTPVKRFARESDEKLVAANYGVPVIGQLPVGDYNLVTDIYLDGVLLDTFDIIFTVESC